MKSPMRLGVSPTRHLNPHRFLQPEVWRLSLPTLEPWVVWSISLPTCCSQFIHMANMGPPATALPTWSCSHCLATHPLHSCCLSLSLLLVLMYVSSLTAWLSDFHTVQFSGSSGCFLFLIFLLSFFWLCEEAKCIYLHLHLGQNSMHAHSSPLFLAARLHRCHANHSCYINNGWTFSRETLYMQ